MKLSRRTEENRVKTGQKRQKHGLREAWPTYIVYVYENVLKKHITMYNEYKPIKHFKK